MVRKIFEEFVSKYKEERRAWSEKRVMKCDKNVKVITVVL